MYGPAKASRVAGEAIANGRDRLTSELNSPTIGACEEWFIDDSQAFVKPQVATQWLLAMDAAVEAGKREIGNESKSVVRLLCPPERLHEFDEWNRGHIEATRQVREQC